MSYMSLLQRALVDNPNQILIELTYKPEIVFNYIFSLLYNLFDKKWEGANYILTLIYLVVLRVKFRAQYLLANYFTIKLFPAPLLIFDC